MVGIRSFPIGVPAHVQGRTVSFREGSYVKHFLTLNSRITSKIVVPKGRFSVVLYRVKMSKMISHHGSMGRTVYLPIHEWLICLVNVGIYTSPMDPMGLGHIQWSFREPPTLV